MQPDPPPQQWPGQPGYGQAPGQPWPPHQWSGQPGHGPASGPTFRPVDFSSLDPDPPRPRRTGWLLIGLVLLIGSIGGLVFGIATLVRENDRVEDDAVINGTLGSETPGSFVAGGSTEYSIYVVFDSSDDNERERVVRSTECTVQFSDGSTLQVTGRDQTATTTIGDTSSIGSFIAREGRVLVACGSTYGQGSTFLVSPGSAAILAPILLIVGCGLGLFLAIFLVIFGFTRKGAKNAGPTFTV